MATLPRAIYRLHAAPVKIPMAFFPRTKANTTKIYTKPQKRPRIVKAILRKKDTVGGVMLPGIKLYCKAAVIKTARHWCENRHRSVGQDGEPRNKPSSTRSPALRWRTQGCTSGRRRSLQEGVLGKPDRHTHVNKAGPLSYTIRARTHTQDGEST